MKLFDGRKQKTLFPNDFRRRLVYKLGYFSGGIPDYISSKEWEGKVKDMDEAYLNECYQIAKRYILNG